MAQLTQELSGPVGGLSPQQGVADSSTGEAIGQGLNFLAGLTKMGVEGFQKAEQKKAEAQANIDVVSFLDSQASVADALERGDITASEARSRMRNNFRRAAAANPNSYGDLLEANGKFMSQRGLGKVVEDEVDRFQLAEKEALKAGWSRLDYSPEERAQATQAYLEFQGAVAEMEVEQKRIALQRAEIGLQSDAIGLQQKVREEKAKVSLGKINNSYYTKFRLDTKSVIDRFKSGEITPDEAILELQNRMQTTESFIRQAGAEAGSDFISNMTASYTRVHEDAMKVVSGELSLQAYQNQAEKNVAVEALKMSGDPEIVKWAATDRLVKNADLSTVAGINAAVTRYMQRNSNQVGGGNPRPANLFEVDGEQGRADVQAYSTVIRDNLRAFNRGRVDQVSEEQLDDNITNILKGFKAYESFIDSPDDLRGIADLIASPEFGKYMDKKGGLDPTVVQSAFEVYRANYGEIGERLVEEEYKNRTAQITAGVFGIGAETKPLEDMVQPVFNGSGVSFQIVDKDSLNTIGFNRTNKLKLEVTRLNKELAPVVNKLIRMGAHMQGTTDYKKVYDEQVSSLFTGEEAKPFENQATGTRTLRVGDVVNGFEFIGTDGDSRNRANWRKVDG